MNLIGYGSQQEQTCNQTDRSEYFVGPTLSQSTRSRGVDRARADRLHTLVLRSWHAAFRPLVHCSLHCCFMVWWIVFDLATLRLVFHVGLIPCSAASFVASSAFSFPTIPMCLGTHSSCSLYNGNVSYNASISSRMHLMIHCPDWHFGFASDLMPD